MGRAQNLMRCTDLIMVEIMSKDRPQVTSSTGLSNQQLFTTSLSSSYIPNSLLFNAWFLLIFDTLLDMWFDAFGYGVTVRL